MNELLLYDINSAGNVITLPAGHCHSFSDFVDVHDEECHVKLYVNVKE